MSAAPVTWIDGVPGTAVPADDRGLQYGDGLFETILVRERVPRFIAAHRERLRRGLAALQIPFSAEAELAAEIAAATAIAPPLAILKIVITRGSAVRRGYLPSRQERPRRIVSLWPAAPLEPGLASDGVLLGVCGLRLPDYSPLAGHKHLNRLENVLAALQSDTVAAFDSLMLDSSGRLVSGTACNVFLVKAGEVWTPPVDRSGVAGVMRRIVLREAPRLGIVARERAVSLDDVGSADGMFITNARIGVVPVRRVGEHVFAMNELTTRLRHAIEALDA